jgi:hypothetical protein
MDRNPLNRHLGQDRLYHLMHSGIPLLETAVHLRALTGRGQAATGIVPVQAPFPAGSPDSHRRGKDHSGRAGDFRQGIYRKIAATVQVPA